MVSEILQTWYHIEEIYYPTLGRKIRQISDLITDDSKFYFKKLKNTNFLGLKAIGRNNSNNEIAFLEEINGDDFDIVLNFGDISKNFDVPIEDVIRNFKEETIRIKLRHIKFEIEYILTKIEPDNLPDLSFKEWILEFFRPTKHMSFEMEGKIQPEFYITMPKGWRISNADKIEGNNVGLKCYFQQNVPTPWVEITIRNENNETDALKIDPPFIKNTLGIRTYNYLINSDSFKELIRSPEYTQHEKIKYEFSYKSNLSNSLVGIIYAPTIFLIISSILSYQIIRGITLNTTSVFGMAYLIVLLSFAYYYGTLINEGYQLIRKNFVIPVILFSILVAIVVIYKCL